MERGYAEDERPPQKRARLPLHELLALAIPRCILNETPSALPLPARDRPALHSDKPAPFLRGSWLSIHIASSASVWAFLRSTRTKSAPFHATSATIVEESSVQAWSTVAASSRARLWSALPAVPRREPRLLGLSRALRLLSRWCPTGKHCADLPPEDWRSADSPSAGWRQRSLLAVGMPFPGFCQRDWPQRLASEIGLAQIRIGFFSPSGAWLIVIAPRLELTCPKSLRLPPRLSLLQRARNRCGSVALERADEHERNRFRYLSGDTKASPARCLVIFYMPPGLLRAASSILYSHSLTNLAGPATFGHHPLQLMAVVYRYACIGWPVHPDVSLVCCVQLHPAHWG